MSRIFTCRDCGIQINRVSGYRALREGREPRCCPCFVKQRTRSVRDATLLCGTCGEWLPDNRFWVDARQKSRRFRNQECNTCSVARRKRYRRRDMIPCQGGCGTLVLNPRHTPKKTDMCVACANKLNGANRHARWLEAQGA